MKKIFMKFLIFWFYILILLFISCTTHRELIYLQKIDFNKDTLFVANFPDYRIQKEDILYVKVFSLNKEISDLINQTTVTTQQSSVYQNELSMFIYGYTVDDSGFIELPILGKIFVYNKKIDDISSDIKEKALKYINDPVVIVKLISYKYTLLGEVTRPGTYRNYSKQISILEAIGNAGDITDYGNRKNVMVIRTTEKGNKVYYLDLTKKNILNSEAFYLLPNDIVYVPPVKNKVFRVNSSVYSMALSTISTIILILNFITLQSKRF